MTKAVKYRASRAWAFYIRMLPAFMILLAAICVTSLLTTTWLAVQRANDAQRQNDHLSEVFCGFVQPVAQIGRISPPQSPVGASIINGATKTEQGLGCPPLPEVAR